MRISDRGYGEEGRERLTLVPENVDDLWHLAHVLEPGDLVEGDTTAGSSETTTRCGTPAASANTSS